MDIEEIQLIPLPLRLAAGGKLLEMGMGFSMALFQSPNRACPSGLYPRKTGLAVLISSVLVSREKYKGDGKTEPSEEAYRLDQTVLL